MKLSLLLEREPFAPILERTLKRHLDAVTGTVHRVRWGYGRRAFAPALLRGGLWFCNPTINVIFSANARQSLFSTPWREYLYGPSRAVTVGHAAYLLYATAPVARLAAASHRLLIEPNLPDARDTLILGGNTRVRLLDHLNGRSVVLHKDGFSAASLRDELAFRGDHEWLPAPKILGVHDDGQGFDEEFVDGTAADRVFSGNRARDALLWALEVIERLSTETEESVELDAWLDNERRRCREAGAKLARRDRGGRVGDGLKWLDRVITAIGRQRSRVPSSVQVALSHGDLQPGNVLVRRDRRWLIDWERQGRRPRGYDAMTLVLGARRSSSGLVARAKALLAGEGPADLVTQKARKLLPTTREPSLAWIWLRLYLIAELRFHLEENASGPLFELTRGLSDLLDELLGASAILGA